MLRVRSALGLSLVHTKLAKNLHELSLCEQ